MGNLITWSNDITQLKSSKVKYLNLSKILFQQVHCKITDSELSILQSKELPNLYKNCSCVYFYNY